MKSASAQSSPKRGASPGKLGAALLVDAARVNPDEGVAVSEGSGAGALYLLEADFGGYERVAVSYFVEGDFLVAPCVREDGVWGHAGADKLGELEGMGIDEAYVGRGGGGERVVR